MIDVAASLSAAPEPDQLAQTAVAHRAANALRPPGTMRRLDEVAAWLAGWQRTDLPAVDHPALLLAAADHGVAATSVSDLPAQVTVAVVDAIRAGVATSTVLAAGLGVSLRLIDTGVGRPTADIGVADAMPMDRFWSTFEEGREAVATMTVDLLLIGDLGVANTVSAAAVSLALFGGSVSDWVGRRSDVSGEALERESAAVSAAADRVRDDHPLEVLRRAGGTEMVALAGAVYEARLRSIPVLLDGFATTAAVAPFEVLVPGALDHTMAAHRSAETGHGRLLDRLGKPPLLDLELALGEGSGALLAVPLVRAAAVAVTDVATFDEWGLR